MLLALAVRDGVVLYEGSAGEFAELVSLAMRRLADTRKLRDTERARAGEESERAAGR